MHAQAVFTHQVVVVGVDGGGVARAMLEHLFAHLEALLLVVELEHGVHRRELFHGQRLVLTHLGAFRGQDRGVFGNLEAGFVCDVLRGLARHDGVELRGLARVRGAAEHVLLELRLLFVVDEVGLAALELLDERRVDVLMRDDRLLGGADHAVIEVLGKDEVVGYALHVHIGVHVGRRVARTHTEGRLAGRVGRLDHARATGREDRGDARVLHQRAGRLDRRVLDPLDAVRRGACLNGGVTHDARRFRGALLRERVEAENDGATGLQRDERLEDRRRSGVGDGRDAGDHTDRLGDFVDAEHVVFADDAHGLLAGHVVGDVLAREDVLGGLVFHEATAGLVHGHLGEHQVLVQRGYRGFGHNAVHGLLVELLEFLQRLAGLDHKGIHLGSRRGLFVHNRGCFGCVLGRGLLRLSIVLACFCHAILLESMFVAYGYAVVLLDFITRAPHAVGSHIA